MSPNHAKAVTKASSVASCGTHCQGLVGQCGAGDLLCGGDARHDDGVGNLVSLDHVPGCDRAPLEAETQQRATECV